MSKALAKRYDMKLARMGSLHPVTKAMFRRCYEMYGATFPVLASGFNFSG